MRVPLLVALAALALAPAANAQAKAPRDFFGTFAEAQVLDGIGALEQEFVAMREAGVGSARFVFDWRIAQPHAGWADVPEGERARFVDEGGVPTDWSETDRHVAAAARRGVVVLPVVQLAPSWAAKYPGRENSPPAEPQAYARFVAALSRRYGPQGSFWAARPDLPRVPIRHFQLWNEPDFSAFWRDQPFVKAYVALLRATRVELRRADPKARVVLAGISNYSWRALRRLYARGARRYFDVAAVHPFTANVEGVAEIIRRVRAVMDRNGDRRKPLFVTELSWTSAWGLTTHPLGIETSEADQAKKLREAYAMLLRKRRSLRIGRAYWYTWITRDRDRTYSFDYAGLNRLNEDGTVERKPAYFSYQRVTRRAR